jgi:phage terminase large subunit-like protein
MTPPNGSKLKLMGADMKNFIKRLKGRKYPAVGIDEAQDFGVHLQSLVDDVLTPSISDYEDGWIALTGTPGPVPSGYFFDITQNRKYGYSVHEWTLFENPYMPNPREFCRDLLIKREWDETNPTYLREYRNKWVLDVESLWVRYKESLNDFAVLPSLPAPHKYHYIVGVDLGYRDADAIAVLAWHESTPKVYLVEEVITAKQGITELTNQIEHIMKKYDPDKIVMDEGALGKKIGEEMRRQKGIPVHGAEKSLKQQNVEFLNDALRTKNFMAKSNSRFATDSYLVQIDWDKTTPDRIVIKKKPHSDIIDAVLYAFKESPAYTYLAPKAKAKPGTKEHNDEIEKDMFEAELDFMTRQSESGGW